MKKYIVENLKKLDTARMISDTLFYVSSSGKTFHLDDPTVILIEDTDVSFKRERNKEVKNITVERNDSFSYVINNYEKMNTKPLVLDFANPCTPGGGVRRGCRAQEEDLCRRSNLLKALESEEASSYYEINKSIVTSGEVPLRCLLVKNVTIFADTEGVLIDPIVVDVIVMAAPYKSKNKDIDDFELELDFLDIDLENTIEMILDVAESYGYKNVVLGAFGCGAFHNDPTKVAEIFKYQLSSGKYSFNNVYFPILVKLLERDQPNWDAFTKVFK